MKTLTPLVLAITLALAPVGASIAAGTASPLPLDAPVRGEITSRSEINYRDGSRSQLHTIELREGQVVSISLEGPLRGSLTAFHDGDLVSAGRTGSPTPTLVVRARRAGRHTIAVSGVDESAYGPYTLRAETVAAYDGRVLAPGASISDWIDGPRRLSLRIDEPGIYTIDMRSTDFDATLKLEGGTVSISNDDGGDGTNSRISTRLAPGDYTVTADGYGGSRVSGMYQLQITARPASDVPLREGGVLEDNTTANGLYEGAAHSYTFALPERRVVRVDMRSDEIDSTLQLTGNGLDVRDDDGGVGLDSMISRLLEPGDYTVQASAVGEGAGFYSLSLVTSEAPEGAGGGALVLGQPAEATLLPGITDRWTLSVRRAGEYALDMRSGELDSHLRLMRGSETVASDDDGGDNLDARIVHRLEAGEYVLEASAVGGSEGGPYRISAERR